MSNNSSGKMPDSVPVESADAIGGKRLTKAYRTWDAMRGDRPLPSVDDFDPCAFKTVSGTTVLIEVTESDDGPTFRFLAIGSELAERFPKLIYGASVNAISEEPLRRELLQRYRRVVETGKPHLVRTNRHVSKTSMSYEALTLPLADPKTGRISRLLSIAIHYPEHEFRRRFGAYAGSGLEEVHAAQ